MTRTFTSLLISILLLNVSATAQKRPVRKPDVNIRKDRLIGQRDILPEIKDFAFVIAVDQYGNSTIKIQRSESADYLTIGQVDDFFSKFLVLQNSKTLSTSNKNYDPQSNRYLDPIVIVKPEAEVEIGTLIKAISAARVSYNSRIKIDAGNGTYLSVPRKPDVNPPTHLKPNPLTLVVKLDENGGLTLNNDEQGSLSNLTPLTKFLTTIFKEREVNGVYVEGTNDIERTVFIKMPMNSKFIDLTTLAKAIGSVGSGPIGLQIDDDEDALGVEMITIK